MLDRIGQSLAVYLDLLSVRQKLVASNIANLDTPGYKTRDLDFQGEMSAALNRFGAGPDAPRLGHSAADVEGLAVNNDGNNVNLEREARMTAENAMRFELATTLLGSRFRNIRLAIKEGNS